ncbi:MAG: AAA family ATPase [Pirellulales bacterium]|nr:AAA family ATPase [Pirellulales bacterium]
MYNFLQALRRQWLLASGIGILLAVTAGLVVWFGIGPRYTARAFFRISMEKEGILKSSDRYPQDQFEILKNTHQQLLRSRWVLGPALRNPEINQLPVLKREKDQLKWLTDELSVSFPGRAEIMEISLSLPNPSDAAKIVAVVVDSYNKEVLDVEGKERRERLDELDRIYSEADREVRRLLGNLRNLAERFGGATDSEAFVIRQRMLLEQLASSRNQLTQADIQLGQLRLDLAQQKALYEAEQTNIPTNTECTNYAFQDQELKRLAEEVALRKMYAQETRETINPASTNPAARGYVGQEEQVYNQYEEKMETLRREIHQKKLGEIEREIKKLEASIVQSENQKTRLEKETSQQREQAEQLGGTSIEVEMYRNDLKNQEQTLQSIAMEREKIRAELRAPSRILLLEKPDPNNPPISQSNLLIRIALTFFSTLSGFAVSVAGVGFWDMQKKRINTAREITERLGLPVIGSVPLIPPRVLRQLGSPQRRSQLWQIRLTESIDGITARLLHRSETEQHRVVMVTSAVSGEGKTTLATQIAISLARSGRRTVLVDFDLRQPAFDEIFGLSRSPGVSEILRNELEPAGAVQETGTPNLFLITAGQWNRATMAALANGAAASLLKELREDFDFVILDTSPILPVADARFVSQSVDSTVLCIFRDMSEMPQLQATCEILQAFGVHSIEAVVTGSYQHLDSRRLSGASGEFGESSESSALPPTDEDKTVLTS